MEWYDIGSGGNEFPVPKEREESDRVLESLNQWGMNAPENLWISDKYFATTESKRNGESKKLMVKNSSYGRDYQSGSSGVCEVGSDSKALVHRPTVLWPDQQLDNLEGIDEMDDSYLSSLLEDLPVAEDTHGSKYLKTHAFSAPVDWDDKNVGSSQFVPFHMGTTNDSSPLKSPVDKGSVQSKDNELMGDETSMEGSVLSDLESVMVQMTEKTRLCFRDALYRLAESSKQFNLIQCQPDDTELDKPTEPIAGDETPRSKTSEKSEPETNTIDRAVANLMFNKMQLNSQDLPTISMSSEPSPTSTKRPCNFISYQPKNPRFFQSDQFPTCDRQVPILSQQFTT